MIDLQSRAKGRDFYDTMFLWQFTEPDYDFLRRRMGIADAPALLGALTDKLAGIDLSLKSKDFEHLLFTPANAARILQFPSFLQSKIS